jgi:hypothetical protein
MNELSTRPALTIQDCMAMVMGDVREVAKGDRNTQQGFSFRGVDAVVNAVAPALRKHGVIVLPSLQSVTYENVVVGQKQTHMLGCRVVVTYRFVGPGGDWLDATVAGEAMDAGDKATAKAMSVAFRIALLQALALPTDDTDPDATSYERSGATSLAPAAPGESTATANTGQGSVTSARDANGAQPPQDGGSPSHSATDQSKERTGPEEAPAGDGSSPAGGGGSTPAGASTNYLSRDDQALLKAQFGGQVAAIQAYQAKFPSVTRLADITYEMRDEMEGASV